MHFLVSQKSVPDSVQNCIYLMLDEDLQGCTFQ